MMRRERGTTLLEVIVGVAITGLLAAMLAAAAAESRRHASLSQNFANLQQFAAGTTTYFADYGDRYWGFTWAAGHDGPFGTPGTDLQAIADQAADIMNRRGGAMLDRVSNWYPSPYFAHLPLLEHLGTSIRPAFVVAPEDKTLQVWQSDPFNIGNLPDHQRPGAPPESIQRWGFSSSYELGPAFSEADARWETNSGSLVTTVDQHGLPHNRWSSASPRFGSRFAHEVVFPSQKIMLYERAQRHFGPRDVFFMHAEARVPMLSADGAATVRQTANTHFGFRPNSARFNAPTLVRYEPSAWEPPTLSGTTAETLIGYYRWTRGGLQGRDVGGVEINTSDW